MQPVAGRYGWSIVFSSVCSKLHLTCICFTSYTWSALCNCWFSLRKGAILSPQADKWKIDCKEIRREFVMSWCQTHGSVCKIRLGCHSNMTENKAVFFNFFIYLLTILLNWVVSLVSVVSFWWFCFTRFGGFKFAVSFCCFKFLPTDSGKSLMFHITPFALDF